jgi:hypothetical protein
MTWLYALRADAEKPQHNTTQQRIANSVQVDPVVVGRVIVCLLRTSIDVTKKSRPFAKEPYKLRVPEFARKTHSCPQRCQELRR